MPDHGDEFFTLMARAGITIPEARVAGLLAAHADLREMVALLHARHDAALEPATVYTLAPSA